jgi:GNAT superfamily N-acetyltransferase
LAFIQRGSPRDVLLSAIGRSNSDTFSTQRCTKNPGSYAKELVELPDWRIGCIFTAKRHRGSGVARAAVAAALDEIRAAGGGIVEAYPEQMEDRPPQRGAYLHTGPESLFTAFGFVRVRKIAKWRWVMRLELPVD